jgi:hypothetical protein
MGAVWVGFDHGYLTVLEWSRPDSPVIWGPDSPGQKK